MYRKRLRPKYSEEQLRSIYRTPHNSVNWWDHRVRVRQTIALGKEAIMPIDLPGTVVDLSCGNGVIATELAHHFKATRMLGDFAYHRDYDFTGPIEETIEKMLVRADIFICSETIEHLDDPDAVLGQIREHANQLLLSTPIAEKGTSNPEHYWGWDQEAVSDMLHRTGWRPYLHTDLTFPGHNLPYEYQIWLCK